MSDLIVTYEGLTPPSPACAEAPPPPKRKGGIPQDSCFINLPLVDNEDLKGPPHPIRFERKGDQFVLSPKNHSENLTWIGRHQNLPEILNILRLTETTFRSVGHDHAGEDRAFKVVMMIAQFISIGKIRFPSNSYLTESPDGTGKEEDLANFLLGFFFLSGKEALGRVLGALTVFRGDSFLSKEARGRIEWISSILDLLPSYEAFRRHFITSKEETEKLSPTQRSGRRDIDFFIRKMIIAHWRNSPILYDQYFFDAFYAYQSLRGAEDAKLADPFCKALHAGLGELRAAQGEAASFVADCQSSLRQVEIDLQKILKPIHESSLLDKLNSLEKSLQISRRRTDVVPPVLEGISCALGIIGVGLAEGLLKNNEGARLGLGTTSASLLGGGCASLAGHFFFPAIAKDKVKNRFALDGITFGVGAVVGGATYLGSVLGTLNRGFSPGLDTKFGVDEHGR